MKTNLCFTLILGTHLAFFTSCKKEIAVAPIPDPTPIPITPIPATPVPTTPEPIVLATPVPRRLTPDGIFYVIQYFSVESDGGIVGIKPGTKVKQLKDLGSILHVTDGVMEFDVKKELLTNDLDIAARAGHLDRTGQQQIKNALTEKITIHSAFYGLSPATRDVTSFIRNEVAAGRTTIKATEFLTVQFSINANPPLTATRRVGESITFRTDEPLTLTTPDAATNASRSIGNSLEKGAYNKKKGVTSTPNFFLVNPNR